jgi:serine protease Do
VKVVPGSPAAKAGLKASDILVSIDGRWTLSPADTYAAAAAVPAGRAVPVVIQRDEHESTVFVQPLEGL